MNFFGVTTTTTAEQNQRLGKKKKIGEKKKKNNVQWKLVRTVETQPPSMGQFYTVSAG